MEHPKGAKNRDIAMKFMNVAMQPQNQAEFCAKFLPVGPTNTKAYQLIAPARAKLLPSEKENLKSIIRADVAWKAANAERLTNEWTRWKAK